MSAIRSLLRPKTIDAFSGNIWFYNAKAGNQTLNECLVAGFFDAIINSTFRIGDILHINAIDDSGIYNISSISNGIVIDSNSGGGISFTPILPLKLDDSDLSIEPSSNSTSGSMSINDYNKLLYSTTLNEVNDIDLNVNNKYYLPLYYQSIEVFAINKNATIVLPNFLNDPNKSSYDYDGDIVWIGSNFISQKSVIVVSETTMNGGTVLIPIYDPLTGVMGNLVIANNVSVGFRWCDNNPDPNNRINPVQWRVIDNGR
jgi:hypothetical protein